MIKIGTIQELREQLRPYRHQKIGLVPTMGYLHEGHLSLVKKARETCDIIVMSIFVNPLQFGPGEDFERYPRDIARDEQLAEKEGVDILFTPSVEEMYPSPVKTTVHVKGITDTLCGASRPGHFDGVATVVSKLFHIVQPDYAFFGQKDAQQVAVIEQMVQDLNMPVDIIPCPIVREADGLAMSSRNVYLSPEEREQATVLYQSMQEAKRKIEQGESDAFRIRSLIMQKIREKKLAEIDYVEVLTYPGLEPIADIGGKRIIIALAVKFGQTRLIDNMIFNL
ncbi:MAG: pantoate--beta-alanine ligase [Bacillaceae bacterium]|nr:pantoate--beta-alanine ligase [Bacillaceae bacterium]